jgi:formylmethanofuran dehydrogenase subunit E
MMCEHCELEYGNIENDLIGYCAVCDSRMFNDDAYYVEGEMICADCYENETIICEGCGESYYRHGEHTRYDEETDSYYCSWCYNDLLDEREREKKEEYFDDNEEVA